MRYWNILYLTVSLLAVIANSLCLSAMGVGRMRLNARYKLILNLLVVDLAMAVQMSGQLLAVEFDPHHCLLAVLRCHILFYNLLFTLLLIACQHYVLIVYPLRSTTWLRHTGKAILVSWVLAALPDVASIIYSINQTYPSFCDSMLSGTYRIRFYVYLALVGVSSVVFLVVYIRVYLASRSSDHPYTSPGAQLQHQQQQQRHRYKVNTSLLILATFLLGYLPYSIVLCLLYGGIISPEWCGVLTFILFRCNNLCDPLIYAVRTKKFKTAFRKMFCRHHHPGDLRGSPDIEL